VPSRVDDVASAGIRDDGHKATTTHTSEDNQKVIREYALHIKLSVFRLSEACDIDAFGGLTRFYRALITFSA
jgi:hypothetical protein